MSDDSTNQPNDWRREGNSDSGASEPTAPYGSASQGYSSPGYATPPPPGQAPAGYGQAPNYGQPTYGQPTYGQPTYGQPGQMQTPYGGPYGPQAWMPQMAPKHPNATTAMVLGIVGLAGSFVFLVPILLSPFAWAMGRKAVKEIDANPGKWSGRSEANTGLITGMIGTIFLILGVLFILFIILVAAGVIFSSGSSGSSNV